MQQPVMITQFNLDYAFEKARTFEAGPNAAQLKTLQKGPWIGKVEALWDKVQQAIQDAFTYGKEAVTDTINLVVRTAEDLVQQAGSMAKEVHNLLLARLQRFVKCLIESAMKLVPSTMVVGETEFTIDRVCYNQKLVLGGSLKLNIIEAIDITSSGELELSVEYAKKS